jgi:long-subunit acyl-CoA synthetase (AMP-forming)
MPVRQGYGLTETCAASVIGMALKSPHTVGLFCP